MKRTKKFLSLILSVILLMSLAMPVMAAQNDGAHNHTIIINETVAGHKYEAYQIFSGEVAEVDGNMVLSNPVWGSGVDANKKVDWVMEDDSTVSLTLMEALKTQGVNPDYSLYLEANDVAGIVTALSKNNTTAHAENFAVIVGKYLTNNSENYKTSKAYTHKKDGDNLVYDDNGKPVYEETPENGTINNYQIRGLADGYYLVKENAEVNIPSATHTDYILEIVQDVTVTPKDGEVTVDKAIIEGTKPVDACANNIGDEIEFVITGTLPNNYDEFDTYYHAFVDTMSEGLTLDPTSIKVHTLNGDFAKEVDSSYYDVYVPGSLIPEGNTYLLPLENYDTKGSTANLVVEFSDLTLLSESNN